MSKNELIMLQVSMALYGVDVPTSKKDDDIQRRQTIFDIVAPYCLSADDIEAVNNEYADNIRDLWLASFTCSQNVMIYTKLMSSVKEHFRNYFPPNGLSPKACLGRKIGLAPGQSILDR